MEPTAAAGGLWLVPVAFVGGLCTSLNPCAYPMLAAVAAYVGGDRERSRGRSTGLAFTFLLGLSLTYAGLGAAGCLLGPVLGLSRAGWSYLAGTVCVLAGLVMADVLRGELPAFNPAGRRHGKLHGFAGSLLLGVLLGLVASPCATPPLVAVLSLAAAQRQVGFAALLLFVYALGHGLPAVLLGLLAGSLREPDRWLQRGRVLKLTSGWLLVAVGFYFLVRA